MLKARNRLCFAKKELRFCYYNNRRILIFKERFVCFYVVYYTGYLVYVNNFFNFFEFMPGVLLYSVVPDRQRLVTPATQPPAP